VPALNRRVDGRNAGVIGRRILGLALLAPALPALAQGQPRELRFRIIREGSQIGTQRTVIEPVGDGLAARIEVDIAVRVAGIVVFRFGQRFTERWQAGRLVSADGRRDRNGTVTEVRARAEAGGVVVQGPEGTLRLPADAAPLTWWDPTRFGRPLFATDTGKPVTGLRVERLPRSGGGEILRVAGGGEDTESQYGPDGSWLAWQTRAEDGSTVRYERM